MRFLNRMVAGMVFTAVLTASRLAAAESAMEIGTNFWARIDWTGEHPFQNGTDFEKAWNSGTSDYRVVEDVWNPVFLEEIDFYTVLRFMDWVPTNKSSVVTWSQRKLPADADQTAPFKDQPGVAIEWMIDLCNRTDADMWFCVPHAADDDYHLQLATLVATYMKPSLRIWVEYSNEVWNFSVQKDHATREGQKLGIKTQEYVAHRSARMWQTFADVFGDQFESRVVKVICGQSTNSGIAREQLNYLYSDNNPTGLLPDAYGTAPYFGGNGFDAAVSNAFEVLKTDIFDHRWDKPSGSSRIDNVRTHYNLIRGYDKEMKLVSYEGGQHVTNYATLVNYDPRMYELYLQYLAALSEYVSVFVHYTNCGSCSDGGCWGAKKYTGQPADEAPKYKALLDFAQGVRSGGPEMNSSSSMVPAGFQLFSYPNPFNGSTTIQFSLSESARVQLNILNVSGQQVRALMDGSFMPGSYRLLWNATDDSGRTVPSGIYLVSMTGRARTITRKIMFVK